MLQLEKEYPESNSGQRATIAFLDDAMFRDFRAALWILLAAVGVVLLIACANIAHLLWPGLRRGGGSSRSAPPSAPAGPGSCGSS